MSAAPNAMPTTAENSASQRDPPTIHIPQIPALPAAASNTSRTHALRRAMLAR